MAPTKSHVTFLGGLVQECLVDGHLSASSPRDLDHDVSTISRRVDQEGLGFLTKTLPKLGKALDEALESGTLCVPREFKKISKGCNLPAFMQVSFKALFDSSGRLLPVPDPYAVQHLRQICFMFYKYEQPVSPEQSKAAIAKFFQIEHELYLQGDFDDDPVTLASSYHLRDILAGFDPLCIVPKHGPGAVATGEFLDEKFSFKRILNRAQRLYPFMEFFMTGGYNELEDRFDWYKSLKRVDETCSKICLVPKDSRGPRLISSEPLEQMFLQQGLSRSLVNFIENHPRMRGNINFTDQTINGTLARIASFNSEYATLDLSDASDRISLKLVQRLFNNSPLLEPLEALRSTHTLTPDGVVVPLFKHAPMGSALCFPILALSVWSLLSVGLSHEMNIPLRAVEKMVFVYGDDIIVPKAMFSSSVKILHSVGLKVNEHKSYHKGFFRESCGVDAFYGIDVTPTRIKTPWTTMASDGRVYVSYVQTANHMRMKGYVRASQQIIRSLEPTFGLVPYVTSSSGLPGLVVETVTQAILLNRRKHVKIRTHPHYQCPVARGSFLTPIKKDTILDDWSRLLRNLITGDIEEPSVVVSPRSTRIKRGWRCI